MDHIITGIGGILIGIDLLARSKEHANVSHSIEIWRWLLGNEGKRLLAAGKDTDPTDVGSITRLRKHWSLEQVSAAMELIDARRRAALKYPLHPPVVCDRSGIEQATPESIAIYKSDRIKQRVGSGQRIHDLACGIGGDAMSLAHHFHVTAIDVDPIRCWMTRCNAECETVEADLLDSHHEGDWFHLDPGRRAPATGRRLHDPNQWHPPLSSLSRLSTDFKGGIVKLGPGVAIERLPLETSHELEFISTNGRLSQAHLWLGELAASTSTHRATRLPTGLTETGTPIPTPLGSLGSIGEVLCVPDPALERSMLHGNVAERHGLVEPAPGLGLMTGDRSPACDWFTSFSVDEVMPWREDRVARWLATHDTGIVEVKTRDRTVDPDRYQRRFSGSGSIDRTLFVLRPGRPVVAIITRRADNRFVDDGPGQSGETDPAVD